MEDISYKDVDMEFDPLNDGFSVSKLFFFLKNNNAPLDFDSPESKKAYVNFLDKNKPEMEAKFDSAFIDFDEEWVHIMADSDNAEDEYVAGMCFLLGIKVVRNCYFAYKSFLCAAERKHKEAAYQLSVMILKGLVDGYSLEWWLKTLAYAVRLGDQNAIDQWKDLENATKATSKVKAKKQINNGALFILVIGITFNTVGVLSLLDNYIIFGIVSLALGIILSIIGFFGLNK